VRQLRCSSLALACSLRRYYLRSKEHLYSICSIFYPFWSWRRCSASWPWVSCWWHPSSSYCACCVLEGHYSPLVRTTSRVPRLRCSPRLLPLRLPRCSGRLAVDLPDRCWLAEGLLRTSWKPWKLPSCEVESLLRFLRLLVLPDGFVQVVV
jgi:hypothetical protein